jgi:hypothetical protein
MQKKVLLAVALSGLLLPALAPASQPLLVRFDGHTVPMHETVQVMHTADGNVRVHTWSWHGPDGAATLQVSESRGVGASMPSWALAQMRELRMQMRQMHRIEAAMEQSLFAASPSVSVDLAEPLVLPFPQLSPSLQMRLVQPLIVPQTLLPERVIVIRPTTPHLTSPSPASHQGLRT